MWSGGGRRGVYIIGMGRKISVICCDIVLKSVIESRSEDDRNVLANFFEERQTGVHFFVSSNPMVESSFLYMYVLDLYDMLSHSYRAGILCGW